MVSDVALPVDDRAMLLKVGVHVQNEREVFVVM